MSANDALGSVRAAAERAYNAVSETGASSSPLRDPHLPRARSELGLSHLVIGASLVAFGSGTLQFDVARSAVFILAGFGHLIYGVHLRDV